MVRKIVAAAAALGMFASVMFASAVLNSRVAAGAAVSTPFHQCPAVGASPSCQLLLVVNPDRTVSVQGDPAVHPYDGLDDTLVGVVNNSLTSVSAITVTGPRSGLSLFDGDGLCTYGVAGCPFGATGYEGPNTKFVTDSALRDKAEVDFTGGLVPGQSRYFSLEGALTAASITVRQGTLRYSIASLGDSFSSGEGNPPFDPDSNDGCDRSSRAWPRLLHSSRADLALVAHLACSGATSAALSGAFDSEPPQESQLAGLPKPPTFVTLTIGGNDIGFSAVLRDCFVVDCYWDGTLAATSRRIDTLATYIQYKYQDIQRASPTSRLIVVGYPNLFPRLQSNAVNCGWLSNNERATLVALSDKLNNTLANAAAGVGAIYAPTVNSLNGHELCTASSWVNPIGSFSSPTFNSQGHPNASGQIAMETAVLAKIPQ